MTRVKGWLKQAAGKVGKGVEKPLSPAEAWAANGRLPWGEGYAQHKRNVIRGVLEDENCLEKFRGNRPLPVGFGLRLDERVVEYPWMMARLRPSNGYLLDAGATLIFPYLLAQPVLKERRVILCTLPMDKKKKLPANAQMVYSDLRQNPLAAGCFQEIVCISTLEHVGMDNGLYTAGDQFRQSQPQDFRVVLQEFNRLLAPGGHLFLTVPFGSYQNLGWLQQYDQALLEQAVAAFGGRLVDSAFYRYRAEGWQVASAADCADCRYFDIHQSEGKYDSDYAAAARAVACLQLAKS